MIVVNIHEVKAKLSEYLEAVARGERVMICKRNRPIAELRPVASERTAPRPIGGAKGRFTVPASFFDPLPNELLEAFGGEPVTTRRSVAAESRPMYGSGATVSRRGKRR
jgi:prevent-host-death family protein